MCEKVFAVVNSYIIEVIWLIHIICTFCACMLVFLRLFLFTYLYAVLCFDLDSEGQYGYSGGADNTIARFQIDVKQVMHSSI